MWKHHNALLQYEGGLEFYVDVDLQPPSDRPKSKNHVTINCRWTDIVDACDWERNKMVRFKLVDYVEDKKVSLPSREKIIIPVFHMC